MLRAVITDGGDGVPIMSHVKGLRGVLHAVLTAVLTADLELFMLGELGLDVRKEDPVRFNGGVALVLGVRRGDERRGELLRGVLLAYTSSFRRGVDCPARGTSKEPSGPPPGGLSGRDAAMPVLLIFVSIPSCADRPRRLTWRCPSVTCDVRPLADVSVGLGSPCNTCSWHPFLFSVERHYQMISKHNDSGL